MNIEEIKKKVDNYKRDLISSRECCDVVDLSDEVLWLLDIIEHSEKALESASKQLRDDLEEISLEYGSWSEDMEDSDVLKEVKSALQVIRGK